MVNPQQQREVGDVAVKLCYIMKDNVQHVLVELGLWTIVPFGEIRHSDDSQNQVLNNSQVSRPSVVKRVSFQAELDLKEETSSTVTDTSGWGESSDEDDIGGGGYDLHDHGNGQEDDNQLILDKKLKHQGVTQQNWDDWDAVSRHSGKSWKSSEVSRRELPDYDNVYEGLTVEDFCHRSTCCKYEQKKFSPEERQQLYSHFDFYDKYMEKYQHENTTQKNTRIYNDNNIHQVSRQTASNNQRRCQNITNNNNFIPNNAKTSNIPKTVQQQGTNNLHQFQFLKKGIIVKIFPYIQTGDEKIVQGRLKRIVSMEVGPRPLVKLQEGRQQTGFVQEFFDENLQEWIPLKVSSPENRNQNFIQNENNFSGNQQQTQCNEEYNNKNNNNNNCEEFVNDIEADGGSQVNMKNGNFVSTDKSRYFNASFPKDKDFDVKKNFSCSRQSADKYQYGKTYIQPQSIQKMQSQQQQLLNTTVSYNKQVDQISKNGQKQQFLSDDKKYEEDQLFLQQLLDEVDCGTQNSQNYVNQKNGQKLNQKNVSSFQLLSDHQQQVEETLNPTKKGQDAFYEFFQQLKQSSQNNSLDSESTGWKSKSSQHSRNSSMEFQYKYHPKPPQQYFR